MNTTDAAMAGLNATTSSASPSSPSPSPSAVHPDVCDESFDDDDGGVSSIYFQALVYGMYIAIFVIAMLGNGIVCYVVRCTPRMRTVTNIFIANLAVGDILMSVFCVPFSFVSVLVLGHWPFGRMLCHLVNYSQAVSVLVSAYTLVAISVDRYSAIMWPLRPRITKRCAKGVITAIWLVALLTALPIPIVSGLLQPPNSWHEHCDKFICQEQWPTVEHNFYYTLCLLTLQFVVPLTVLVFTYTRIAIAVWGKRPPGEAENSRDRRMEKSKRKMIKMMVTVVIVFTICWLPFNVLTFQLNDDTIADWWLLPYMWFAFHWLAMSHSCYNPVIYCYMNARFRCGFRHIWHRLVYGHWWCACLRRRGGQLDGGASFGGGHGGALRRDEAIMRQGGCASLDAFGRSSISNHQSRRTGESQFAMGGIENSSTRHQFQRINTTTTVIGAIRQTRASIQYPQKPDC